LPFQLLAKQLKPIADFIRSSGCPPAKLISRPHLSIARRLPEDVYNKAINAYAQKTFHESFMLDELVLLRRQHQFDTCKTIQVFRLRPAGHDLFSDVA
jgi:2'-5' RNA ligase